MSLTDRIQAAERAQAEARSAGASVALVRSAVIDELKEHAVTTLFQRIGARINDSSLTDEQLREYVRSELEVILQEQAVTLSSAERKALMAEIEADALGLGPIQQLIDDDSISEIMVNHPHQIYIEQNGRLTLAPVTFSSEEQLRRVIERIVAKVGRRIDESSPLVDARLADGSRVNAVIPPLAVRGSSLTIRKFAKKALTVDDLIRFGSITPEVGELLELCVRGRLNILVSGGTGTGKTTLLNVLSSFIPEGERIVTIEDAIELSFNRSTSSSSRAGRRTSRGAARSRSATSSRTRCACAPTVWSSASAAAVRPSTCCRP